jgi:hypothetical protein
LIVPVIAAIAAFAALTLAASPAFGGYGPKLAKGQMGKRVLVNTDRVGFMYAGNEKGGNKAYGKRRKVASPFTMNNANAPEGFMRLESRCPRGKRALGGGVFTSPTPDPLSGGGVFPGSYERLGAQHGWHSTVDQVNTDANIKVTLQAMCANYSGDIKPYERFVKSRDAKNVAPGETKRFTQTCRGGRKLVTGGYLSSELFDTKGVYITESRATANGWTVLAHGVAGGNGGQVTAIAYCIKTKKRMVREVVSAPVPVVMGAAASAVAPPCPRRTQLIAGGFSGPGSIRIYDGGFAGKNAWTTSAVAYGPGHLNAPLAPPSRAPVGTLTATAYCY